MSFSNIMDSNSYSADHPVDPATESLIAARDRILGPAYRLFYQRPVPLVRGEGTRLYDADGACYLDAYNNVASVGRCHPHVVEAVTRQLSTLQDAGLPVLRSLRILERQMKPSVLKNALIDVVDYVESGAALADALGRHPKGFNMLSVTMTQVGASGAA